MRGENALMRRSKLKRCPLCGRKCRTRGYSGHLALAHGIARPCCGKCGARGVLVYWSERGRKLAFRCPRCYRYLGVAPFEAAMFLPLIEGDYEDLKELRRTWRRPADRLLTAGKGGMRRG